MQNKQFKARVREIRRWLSEKKIGSLVVTRPANVTYVTGFSGDDSWAVITPRLGYLLTDSRYTEQAKNECSGCRIIERKGTLAEEAGNVARGAGMVAVEESASIADLKAIRRNAKVGCRTIGGIIESIRGTKDKGEVSAIRASARIAAKAFERMRDEIRAGLTENEMAGMLELEIRRLGSRPAFETIVAFGPNASRPHHKPTGRRLRKSDTILIDFGVRYRGYCCDLTRCFVVGQATAYYKKVYEAVEEAQRSAIKMVKAGVKTSAVDAVARDVIRRYGLPIYGHGTGHGLGLEVHELPIVSARNKGRLRAGEVVTIEPAVYIPGKLGVRIEDDVLVTESGCEVLTRCCRHRMRPIR
jgi:Xaa-Pro aminopeptidase